MVIHQPKPDPGPLRPTYRLVDLSSLSISSVAPIFSVAAAGGAMVRAAGSGVPLAIVLIAVPFLVCSWIFLSLNQHFPHAGASYHWSRRIVGLDYSNFQAWIVLMAYFWSIPPILIPAAQFTLAALGNHHPSGTLQGIVAMFWALFSVSVLLCGAQVTARVTQIFLLVEVVFVGAMAVVGYAFWNRTLSATPLSSGQPIHWSGVVVCMVIAATIVDGWEIDSYASEESQKPRLTPGWGGIIGAGAVVLYYLIIWPILLHEVPLLVLGHSSDVLTTWSARTAPQFLPWLRIAIIASTAGSLWLTTFILSRALFSMARDRILPRWLSHLNRHKVPKWAIVLPVAGSVGIVLGQIVVPQMTNLFALVLSSAGFFLVAEFFLDSVNMLIFLLRQHHLVRHTLKPHHHLLLLFGSTMVALSLGTLAILFFRFGPKYIGSGIDRVTALMLITGIAYVLWLRRQSAHQQTVVFDPEDESQPRVAGSHSMGHTHPH